MFFCILHNLIFGKDFNWIRNSARKRISYTLRMNECRKPFDFSMFITYRETAKNQAKIRHSLDFAVDELDTTLSIAGVNKYFSAKCQNWSPHVLENAFFKQDRGIFYSLPHFVQIYKLLIHKTTQRKATLRQALNKKRKIKKQLHRMPRAPTRRPNRSSPIRPIKKMVAQPTQT